MWLTIIAAISSFLPLAGKIAALWQSSAGFTKIADEVATAAPSALRMIEDFAGQMWPAVEKKVQQVLGALHLWAPDSTKWVQEALNAAQALGFIKFGPPLAVDGIWGNKTFAAVVALQTRLGVPVLTGAVTDLEYKALNALLEGKLPPVAVT